jgi:hypothetical protein
MRIEDIESASEQEKYAQNVAPMRQSYRRAMPIDDLVALRMAAIGIFHRESFVCFEFDGGHGTPIHPAETALGHDTVGDDGRLGRYYASKEAAAWE